MKVRRVLNPGSGAQDLDDGVGAADNRLLLLSLLVRSARIVIVECQVHAD
jgi:hypothetical protein